MELDEYQKQVYETDETKKKFVSLFGMAGEVGSIFSAYKKKVRDREDSSSFQDELAEELGDALWYLSSIASLHELSLNDIAKRNIDKARSLFDEGVIPDFDSNYPTNERLPRSETIEFRVDHETGRSQMYHKGAELGDPLSDNSDDEDYYRFHDAFHLAFLTHLGWSPVFRKLLDAKRRSDPQTDENEDGARAIISEEAISAIVFSAAEENAMFVDRRSVSFGLLKTIGRLARKFEVRSCTLKQWREAIWDGCRMYQNLVNHQGGSISFDMDSRSMTFTPPVPRPNQ